MLVPALTETGIHRALAFRDAFLARGLAPQDPDRLGPTRVCLECMEMALEDGEERECQPCEQRRIGEES